MTGPLLPGTGFTITAHRALSLPSDKFGLWVLHIKPIPDVFIRQSISGCSGPPLPFKFRCRPLLLSGLSLLRERGSSAGAHSSRAWPVN